MGISFHAAGYFEGQYDGRGTRRIRLKAKSHRLYFERKTSKSQANPAQSQCQLIVKKIESEEYPRLAHGNGGVIKFPECFMEIPSIAVLPQKESWIGRCFHARPASRFYAVEYQMVEIIPQKGKRFQPFFGTTLEDN